jgi:hypothetical protein
MTEEPSESEARTEAPRPQSEVFLDACSRAVVEMVWVYNRDSKESLFVLGQARLIADEVPRIDLTPKWDKRLGSKSSWTVYFDSWEMPSAQAYA